jgi:hypothetical protein
MRATSMRRLLGGAAAGLLIGATFLGTAAPAFATVPTASVHDEAIPTAYSAGHDVGYRSTYPYTDGSTLSKLYLVLNTTDTTANTYLVATRNGVDVSKSCTKGLPATCTFKTVRTNEVNVVTAAFTPVAGSAPTADPIWSSSGATTSDGGTSHGDTWTDPAATSTSLSTDSNYAGGFSPDAGGSIANGQAVSALNKQATKLLGLPAGVAASVKDGTDATGACGTIDCSTAFGEWSEVTVGDGQTFSGAFQIVITFYQGTPKGFVHQYPDGNGGYSYELVGACPKKNPAGSAPCFTWSSRDNQATIYTLHNGSWRGL